MENYIIAGVVVLAILSASLYIYKEKKKGKKCIGCPDSCNCSKKNCNSK